MKRMISYIMTAIFALQLTGCGVTEKNADDGLRIVTTVFPEYDWVREIAGDNADITMLLDNGVDLHSYQPTAEDIMKISDCDLFIYVGGESDSWVDDALAEAVNKDMKVIDLMEVIGDRAKVEEPVPGAEETEEEEEEEYDEHIWLSLSNAQVLCREIAESIAEIDEENAEMYRNNAENYINRLSELDGEYAETVSQAEKNTLVFGDRFPFRYMMDDYGLSYYAAFEGCSAETEASFETVAYLAKKIDELGLGCVMTIDGSDQKIAKTIIQNTADSSRDVLMLDSMQSTTLNDAVNGTSYYLIMENNLEVLKAALN